MNRRGFLSFVDGESRFPDSCVHYARFVSFETQKLFLYLRAKEEVLQNEVIQSKEYPHRQQAFQLRLQETQAHLCWIVSNCSVLNKGQRRGKRGKTK